LRRLSGISDQQFRALSVVILMQSASIPHQEHIKINPQQPSLMENRRAGISPGPSGH
jgi:hypothetical protein